MVHDPSTERVGVHSRTAMAGRFGGGSRIGCLREVGHQAIVPPARAHMVNSRQAFSLAPREVRHRSRRESRMWRLGPQARGLGTAFADLSTLDARRGTGAAR